MNAPDIYQSLSSPSGFAPYFKGGLESWASWGVFFKVLAGRTDLSIEEMALFTEATGLYALPQERLREVFLCCGRRSGKSTACALLAVAYGLWGDWQRHLQGGEQPQIFIVSPTMEQGKIILRYIASILGMKQFKHLVKSMGKESVELKNGTVITIKPASWRSSRGWSCGLIIMEELAFFRFEAESANVDVEIYAALKPATANIKNSLICGISTPFVRQGLLWTKSQCWGKPGPVLFWRMPTWRMNPSLTEAGLRKEYGDMSEAEFNSEFGAQEREDLAAFLPVELIDKALAGGYDEITPEKGIYYYGFCDASEGLRKGGDSMTFAVAHAADEGAVVDTLVEFAPPFKPKEVIAEIARVCGRYGVMTITQDNHAIAWISEQFESYKIGVETSELNKSEIYGQFSILANREVVALPQNPKLRTQLMGLFKQNTSSGCKIDHLRNGHDDLCNSACGAACLASSLGNYGGVGFSLLGDVMPDGPGPRGNDFPYVGTYRQ